MKKILGLSMAMLMIASCAVGCGDSDGDGSKKSKNSDFVGNWEAEKVVDENGTEITDFLGIPLAAAFQFEFKEDGSIAISDQLAELSDEDAEETPTGSWKADGNKVTITVPNDETGEDESIEFEYKDERLVAEDFEEEAGGALYLVKVDEFTTFDFESFGNSFGSSLGLDEDSFDFSDSDFDFDIEE